MLGLFKFSPALYLSRAAQGIAGGACMTCTYGLIPDWFPETSDKVISLTEGMAAVGYMAGPLVGGLLYAAGGFPAPFIGTCVPFAVLWILLGFVGKVRGAEDLSRNSKRGSTDFSYRHPPPPSLFQLFNFPMLGAMIAAFMVEFCVGVWTPLVAPFLGHAFGGGSVYAGAIMAIPALSYGLCGALLPLLYPIISKSKIILGGMVVFGVGLFMMDPCHFFTPICKSYHLRVAILIIVQLILGCANTFAFVPTLPIMLDSVKDIPGDSHGAMSGMWNSMVALGQVLGPLFAEELSQYADFGTTMMTLGATMLFVSFVVAHFFSVGPRKKESLLATPLLQRADYGTVILNA
jgi:MFS family permease